MLYLQCVNWILFFLSTKYIRYALHFVQIPFRVYESAESIPIATSHSQYAVFPFLLFNDQILDEFMMAGEMEETSKREILERVRLLEKLE